MGVPGSTLSRSWTRVILGSFLFVAGTTGGCGTAGTIVGMAIVPGTVHVAGGPAPTSTQLSLVFVLADGTTTTFAGTPTWHSDDPATATVVNGRVTGGLAGRTTIRAILGVLEATALANVSVAPVQTLARVPVSDLGTGLVLGSSNAARCIAIDDVGRIHVTWADPVNGLRYARSVDGGLSFQPSVALASVVDAPNPRPVIACGQEGQDDVYVVYEDALGAVLCLRSANGGVTWPAVGVVTGLPAGGEKSGAVRGQTVMVFTTISSTMVRSVDAGATFAAPVPNLLSSSVFNDVLMDPRDLVTVMAISDDPSIHLKVSADDGATFGAQVDSVVASLFYSDYAIDQLGNVFGVSQGAAWVIIPVATQIPVVLPSSLAGLGNPGRSVATDSLNVVHVVRDDAGTVALQTSADSGATLTPEVALDTAASSPMCAGSWSFPGVGVVYVRGGSVFYMHN
jgi:hypothetical protein